MVITKTIVENATCVSVSLAVRRLYSDCGQALV